MRCWPTKILFPLSSLALVSLPVHAVESASTYRIQAAASSQTVYDSGNPTADEQYVLEMINRARANPTAEGTRLGISITEGLSSADAADVGPRAPLAMNKKLLQIAREHSQDMWTNSYFAHNTPGGKSPFTRMSDAGYSYSSAGENIAVGSSSTAAYLEDLLMIDSGIAGRGHRTNLLDINVRYREIGIGYYHGATTNRSGYRDFITQDFGTSSVGPFVLGVVYDDQNNNSFYDLGEGLSGVTITPNSGSWSAITSSSGGYAFPAATSGSLTLVFRGGGLAGTVTKTITLRNANQKVDAKKSEAVSGGGTPPSTPTTAATVDDATSATPTLSGTTLAGATVTIYDGPTVLHSMTANGSGAWTWTVSPALASGVHHLTWTAGNSSGTSGFAPETLVTVPGSSGGTPPATPTNAATLSNATSPTPTVGGTTLPGATVTIYDGATVLHTLTADSSGAWSWTVSPALASGVHHLTWTVSNSSGASGFAPDAVVTVPAATPGTAGTAADGGGGCGLGGSVALAMLGLLWCGWRRPQSRSH